MGNKFKSLLTFGIIIFCIQASNATSNNEMLDEGSEVRQALAKSFALDLKFKTERGVYSVYMSNEPTDEDSYFLKPHLFENMTSFWKSQHQLMLNKISLVQAAEVELSGLDLVKSLMETGDVAEPKSNPVFPLKYQTVNSYYDQIYKFPDSALYVLWSFEITSDNNRYADLNMFSTDQQYYTYLQNSFEEKLRMIMQDNRKKRFKSIQSTLYS